MKCPMCSVAASPMMGIMNRLLLTIVAVIAGCAPAAVGSRPATPAERQAISDANARIVAAIKQGTASAIASELAPDATMLPAGMPALSGRDAIAKLFGALASMGVTDAAITTQEVTVSGDLAVETGTNSLTIKGVASAGKYLVVWKRQSDGSWKIRYDMTNASQ